MFIYRLSVVNTWRTASTSAAKSLTERYKGVPVSSSRFIVLSVMITGEAADEGHESISWLLVSSNNRPLGKAAATYPNSEACREDVQRLREQYGRVTTVATLTEGPRPVGQWTWRAQWR